jgi:hypothetical protein
VRASSCGGRRARRGEGWPDEVLEDCAKAEELGEEAGPSTALRNGMQQPAGRHTLLRVSFTLSFLHNVLFAYAHCVYATMLEIVS